MIVIYFANSKKLNIAACRLWGAPRTDVCAKLISMRVGPWPVVCRSLLRGSRNQARSFVSAPRPMLDVGMPRFRRVLERAQT